MINLTIFNNNLFEAGAELFSQLGIRLNSNTASSLEANALLKDNFKDKGIFKAIEETYFLGLVDDSVFAGKAPLLNKEKISLKEAEDKLTAEYNGLMVFAVRLKDSYSPTRGEIAELTRAFNRVSKSVPVVLLLKYASLLSFAASERTKYKQAWREGEKIGKISLLKDINLAKPHAGHLKILENLKVAPSVADFNALYKQWQEVFNVQLLNKKFYQELANWYFWALRNVEFPDDAEKNRDVRNAISVIRMITRIIFVWFLKEKGLVPDSLFIKSSMDSILNYSDKTGSTFYKAILQNLFFATLNTEMNKDKPGNRIFVNRQYGITNLYRYERFFKDKDKALALFENIPFLNGGLFECLDKDVGQENEIRIDCFSNSPAKAARLTVPDELFFSAEQSVDLNEIYGTKNKTYKVRGLIDILDSYKFTVDENTPIEEEIALDPELLGKVFENLLASYNPETQTTARKQTGSFYTPREIVNYMVDESIIAYLLNSLDKYVGADPCVCPDSDHPHMKGEHMGSPLQKNESRLRHLVAYNDDPHKFTPAEVDALIAAINTLKALDPACGSGAFPMGMLHKLVYILGKLDPDNSKWRELQRQKAIRETEEAYSNEDKDEREKRLLDISEVFENNASDYGRKLYLIENCIFGVDIQPIAVQIAKLRFFVSLIVDQRIDPVGARRAVPLQNRGVRPLPNLETKFVAANTLIGIEKPAQMLLRNPEIDKKEDELKKVRERHFTARTPQTKEKYRKADEKLRAEISELLKKDGFPSETTEKLARWNPYDQNAHADFFDSEWMFGIADGFDVVIGNPPYIRQEDLKVIKPILEKQGYEVYNSTSDIYTYFYEKGWQGLNNAGYLTFITSNKWMRAKYGEKIRKFFKDKTALRQIIDFGGHKVFESAAVDTNILIFQKMDLMIKQQHNAGAQLIAPNTINQGVINHAPTRILSVKSDFNHNIDLTEYFNQNAITMNQQDLDEKCFTFGDDAVMQLKKKIEQAGVPLKDWDMKICRGIITGFNEAYIIGNETKERLCHKDPKSIDVLKPILRGRDISRYGYQWAGLWLIKIESGWANESRGKKDPERFFKETYPAVYDHLKSKGESKGKGKGLYNRDDQGDYWWELRDCDYYGEFEKEKLIYRDVGDNLSFAYEQGKLYGNNTVYFLNTSNKYMLAVLNSCLLNFYYTKISSQLGDAASRAFTIFIEQLPIPKIPESAQQPFITLVDQILAAKEQPPSSPFSKGEFKEADTSALERQIDEMVYALYGLTPEEIAIVEGKR